MKISEITIENFRSIRKATIPLHDYTAFVGPNGSGKSTVLTALRIFFRDTAGSPTDLLVLREEDFHHKDITQEVIITVTFEDLEASAQSEFEHYVRQNKLVVSAVAVWDENSKTAVVKQYGERLVMKEFAEFFRSDKPGIAIGELRSIYGSIRSRYAELPEVNTKVGMAEALHSYESSHPKLCSLERSSDEFYGFSKGANRLQKFVQWVFIPAVKDASTEQLEAKKNALGILLERTVRSRLSFDQVLGELRTETEGKYQDLLKSTEKELESLSTSLNTRIKDWAHPEASIKLQWHPEAAKYVTIQEPLAQVFAKEGSFGGDLSRFGHGLQRSFLFALLQELSASQGDTGTRLILGCEEPELHQHPPQARHLASVLEKLSTKDAQVIVCTHSPHFVSGHGFEDVRLVRKDKRSQETRIGQVSLEDLAKKISDALDDEPATLSALELKVEQTLQVHVNEMFFSSVIILVEGLEDESYIKTYLTLLDQLQPFRSFGCHIVASGGKNKMIQPLAIAELLNIPTFVVFDADMRSDAKKEYVEQQERDNLALLKLCGVEKPVPLPTESFNHKRLCMWVTTMAKEIQKELGKDEWNRIDAEIRKKQGISEGDFQKNAMFIGSILTEGWNNGLRSKLLESLCDSILKYSSKEPD
jgi:putative ATP-dependent endonuclease of OLD family